MTQIINFLYRNNCQAIAALADERERGIQLDERISRVTDSGIILKDKDEKIMDLTNEVKILHQHNQELLELSSKFKNVEQQNTVYQLKLIDEHSDKQSLKNSLSKEKANTAAAYAAHDQLANKVHELQELIDVMTIQLMVSIEIIQRHSIIYF